MLSRTVLTRLVGVVVALGTLGGCVRGEGQQIHDSNDDIPMDLTVKLRGDLEIDVPEQRTTMKLVTISGDVSDGQKVLGVEAVEFLAEGPVKVRPGVAIVGYRGDGKYTIPPGSPFDAVKEQEEAMRTGKRRNRSSVRVEWWPENGEPEFYLRREKPCTVEVDDGGMEGSVKCPQLTQEGSGGKRFSLEFRWKRP